MKTVIQKWGNSLGIRIPNTFVRELNLRNGSAMEITQEEGKIIIVPRPLSLDELLSQVTSETLHDEVPTGGVVGKEIW